VLDVDRIRTNRWRQGSIFRQEDHHRLTDLLRVEIPRGTRVVVVTQDCDVVHSSIEGEPFIEVLFARSLEAPPDGSVTYGKNPRRLQIPITLPSSQHYYECLAHLRYVLDRNILSGLSPDPGCIVESAALKIVRSWLAARYTRTAFPDEFNKRIAVVLRGQSRILKTKGDSLSGIYIAVTPWEELDANGIYRLQLYATIEPDKWADAGIRSEMESVIAQIATAIDGCEGVEVENFELRSEDNITLADLRFLRRWDYDYLSYRDPDATLPAQL
jgi:hypothetical protein